MFSKSQCHCQGKGIHYAKWNTSVTKEQIVNDSLWSLQNIKLIGRESKKVAANRTTELVVQVYNANLVVFLRRVRSPGWSRTCYQNSIFLAQQDVEVGKDIRDANLTQLRNIWNPYHGSREPVSEHLLFLLPPAPSTHTHIHIYTHTDRHKCSFLKITTFMCVATIQKHKNRGLERQLSS